MTTSNNKQARPAEQKQIAVEETDDSDDLFSEVASLAEDGMPDAQFHLGMLYALGKGGAPHDDAAAVHWWTRAGEQEHAEAQHNLGQMYSDGSGVEQDERQAVRWFTRAAEHGYANAQASLGLAYYEGRGAKRDTAEAAKWFRLAGGQGHAGAQCLLGQMCAVGEGVEESLEESVIWLNLAAEQGVAHAQTFLGAIYAGKSNPNKNLMLAHMWHSLAAANGVERSVEKRDEVAAMLTPEQLAESEQRQREFAEEHGEGSWRKGEG